MEAMQVLSEKIQPLRSSLHGNPKLWEMFERCFLNTVETTVCQRPGDTFIVTGDIPAMWLRDSTAQVLHYLRFAGEPAVQAMIRGLIARQSECILCDAYANAFQREPSAFKPFNDVPRAVDEVWERKYEIDSLCYPVWLAEKYLAASGDTSFLTQQFHQALLRITEVLICEQNHANSPYRFERADCSPSDTLPFDGKGAPVGRTGMTWSGFRPSDDACRYGYLIPSNLFAIRAMKAAQTLALQMEDHELANTADDLANEITQGVRRYGVVQHEWFGTIYAYETDGLGHVNLMDDANVPSLLSLPYLETCNAQDPIYQNTRRFVLSAENPYYYQGRHARGIGSPHTPNGYIWPIALCVQAMTSTDENEMAELLNMLLETDANTGFMHESFDPENPSQYTREWFAWANSMFAEMILRLHENGRLNAVLAKAQNLKKARSAND